MNAKVKFWIWFGVGVVGVALILTVGILIGNGNGSKVISDLQRRATKITDDLNKAHSAEQQSIARANELEHQLSNSIQLADRLRKSNSQLTVTVDSLRKQFSNVIFEFDAFSAEVGGLASINDECRNLIIEFAGIVRQIQERNAESNQ